MSVRLMGAVWSHEDIVRSDHLLLLLAIADASNDEGIAWPGVTKLATKTRTSVSTVRRHLRAIEADGWVRTEVRIGTSNVYRLNVSRLMAPGHSDRTPPVNLTGDPGQSDTPVNLTPRSPVTDPPGHSYDRPPRSTVTDRTISEPSVNRESPARDAVAATGPRRAAARPLPADWTPRDDHRTFAATRGVDCDLEADTFRAHAEANDRRQANWDAAFRQWLLKARPSAVGGRALSVVGGRPLADTWKPSPSGYDPNALIDEDEL